MKLIVGLGNPGRKYQGTRHNVGFEVIAKLGEKFHVSRPQAKFDAEICETWLGTEKIALLSPLTYMNLSGRSVRAAVDFFGLPLPNLLVVCDDFSLPLGAIRMRERGSSGGQKGLKNICDCLGTEEVPRLRIGVGIPPPEIDPADYVLKKFSKVERAEMDRSIDSAMQAALCWLEFGIARTMNLFNRTVEAPNTSDSTDRGSARRIDTDEQTLED